MSAHSPPNPVRTWCKQKSILLAIKPIITSTLIIASSASYAALRVQDNTLCSLLNENRLE